MLDEPKSSNNSLLIIHILSFSISSIIYTRTFQSSGYDQTARNPIHYVIKLHIPWVPGELKPLSVRQLNPCPAVPPNHHVLICIGIT